jgi:hypothetical protein
MPNEIEEPNMASEIERKSAPEWPRRGPCVSRPRKILALGAVCTLALAIPSISTAAPARPLVRQLTGTPTGPGGSNVPFEGVSGVAVDAHDNMWVTNPQPGVLNEFNSTGGFVTALSLRFPSPELAKSSTPPASLAIINTSDHFVVTGSFEREFLPPYVEVFDGAGNFLKRSEHKSADPVHPVHIAVDNSTDPLDTSRCVLSECILYVAHAQDLGAPYGDGLPEGIAKFTVNGSGEMTPVAFSGSASYISGNSIVGTPAEGLTSGEWVEGITVDSHGDIYAAINVPGNDPEKKSERGVYEYGPSGEFVRAFTGAEVPSLNPKRQGETGFGEDQLYGVAVDPANGDVVVSLSGNGKGGLDEFDSSGRFVAQTTEANGARLVYPREMAFDSVGDLYVVELTARIVDEFGPGLPPGLVIGDARERTRTGAFVTGSVNPGGQQLSDCHFEIVPKSQFEADGFTGVTADEETACVPGALSIPANSEADPVEAGLTGLVAGTTYYFRLVATTEGPLGSSAASEPAAFTTPGVPVVVSSSVSNISSEFADFHALIGPRGADTTYRFEYDTREYVGGERHGVSVPVPDGDLGGGGPSGGALANVVQTVGGLAAGTSYYYRVVASNEVGSVAGAVCEGEFRSDCVFATLPAEGEALPDGRVYELMTPPNKGSAEDMFVRPIVTPKEFNNDDAGYPSESGDEFLLETNAAFGAFAASGHNAYVFRRDAAARVWRLLPLASEALGVQSVAAGVFDPAGFSRIGVFDNVGSKPSSAGITRMSLVGPPGGGSGGSLYETIASEATQPGESGAPATIVGASRDLGKIVVQVKEAGLLAPGQYPGSAGLYEWADGKLALASVGPDGAPFGCGARLGQGQNPGAGHNAVSADGAKLFLTAPDPYTKNPDVSRGCWNSATAENTPQLYMRTAGATVQVSKPQAGVSDPACPHPEEACRPAIYVGASDDGSRVYFITESELTKNAQELELHDTELYEYDTVNGALTRVSAGEPGSPGHEPGTSGAHVINVPSVAAGGSAVYFSAFGALAPGAPTLTGTGKTPESSVNLYRYDTTTGATRYVATVEGRDYPGNTNGTWWVAGIVPELFEGVALAPTANWYSTPDGRFLLFATTHELTGYSTVTDGACPRFDTQASSPSGHCEEVYRYDAALQLSQGVPGVANNPICVSCDPSGAKPVSNAFFGHAAATNTPAGGAVRAISDDGSYAFFDTADPLVKGDGNSTNDVYEWEAQGRGGCALPQGCVHLISSGQDSSPSFFLGASSDGTNVFFGTHAQLVPGDTDNAGDLYDARIEGFQVSKPGSPPCEGDACQTIPPSPLDPTPGSLSFSGAGNTSSQGAPPRATTPTNAQKLHAALRACRKHKSKRARKHCEAQARKHHHPTAKHATRTPHTKPSRRTRT